MLDQLHSTAYQTSPNGNSLGSLLEGSAETIASLTTEDVTNVVKGVTGSDIVVVGTGAGVHDKLVEETNTVLGGLSNVGSSGKDVVNASDASNFLGSDVRYVLLFFLLLDLCGVVSFVENED